MPKVAAPPRHERGEIDVLEVFEDDIIMDTTSERMGSDDAIPHRFDSASDCQADTHVVHNLIVHGSHGIERA